MNADKQEKWDRRFLALAEHVAQWSKDPSTKVGAVLVDPETNLVLGLGYNGFPRGVADIPERYDIRELKYKLIVHAEVNAILTATRTRGSTLYVWPSFLLPPICNECAKVAIQAGVKEVVGFVVDERALTPTQLRWRESFLYARMMWVESGLKMRGIRE